LIKLPVSAEPYYAETLVDRDQGKIVGTFSQTFKAVGAYLEQQGRYKEALDYWKYLIDLSR
jgi:hypothetical protein